VDDAAVARLQAELERLRESRRRLVAAADADRRAIERQLHAGVQQHLSALAMKLQLAGEAAVADPTAVGQILEEALDDVHQAARDAALLAEHIYPPGLEGAGMPLAMRSAAARAGVRASLQIPPHASYSSEVTATIYWCLSEALQQAETEVTVSVDDDEGAVTFEVVFDGSLGGEVSARLHDRVDALGGSLVVEPGRLSGRLPC
jgi:signal transduction histidine kinase